jgi:hypothetical protein
MQTVQEWVKYSCNLTLLTDISIWLTVFFYSGIPSLNRRPSNARLYQNRQKDRHDESACDRAFLFQSRKDNTALSILLSDIISYLLASEGLLVAEDIVALIHLEDAERDDDDG